MGSFILRALFLSLFFGITLGNFEASRLWAQNQAIRFSTEELSQQSVLPKVSGDSVIRYKSIPLAKRFEVALGTGWNFTEPVYNPQKWVLNLGYSWSDFSQINLQYMQWGTGRNSQYASQLEGPGIGIKLDRIPNLENSIYLNYELRSAYGKISLAKNSVMNLSFYPIFGLGMTKYTHKSYFGVQSGVGWKFYFSRSLALRTDLALQLNPGPNVFSPGEKLASAVNNVQSSDFSDKWKIGTHFDISLSGFF
ncbi:MAG: outer membrane beta-barrel domain-containing protein [Bdellovibrio sp.]